MDDTLVGKALRSADCVTPISAAALYRRLTKEARHAESAGPLSPQ
jgi:hypothetical protein